MLNYKSKENIIKYGISCFNFERLKNDKNMNWAKHLIFKKVCNLYLFT